MEKSYSASYAAAGVDITAGYRSVELMKQYVARTMTESCIGGLGGFGGLFELDCTGMEHPVLISGTRSYSVVSSAICPANVAGRGCASRQCQFAPCVLGVLMRASLPRCSQSASGMMAVSETLARHAQIMPSVRVSGVQRRYRQAYAMSSALALLRQPSVVTLSWVPVYTTLLRG